MVLRISRCCKCRASCHHYRFYFASTITPGKHPGSLHPLPGLFQIRRLLCQLGYETLASSYLKRSTYTWTLLSKGVYCCVALNWSKSCFDCSSTRSATDPLWLCFAPAALCMALQYLASLQNMPACFRTDHPAWMACMALNRAGADYARRGSTLYIQQNGTGR